MRPKTGTMQEANRPALVPDTTSSHLKQENKQREKTRKKREKEKEKNTN